MIAIEIIAVIFTLVSVILSIRRNILCWPIGIVGIIAYATLFTTNKLNADFGLQFIFIIQSLIGWWYWNRGQDGGELPVTRLKTKESLTLVGMMVIAYCLIVYLLTNYTNSSMIYLDSFVSIGSVTANWLLVKKKFESWVIWIMVDIAFVTLFASKGLYMSAVLYSIFTCTAINGFVTWRKLIKK